MKFARNGKRGRVVVVLVWIGVLAGICLFIAVTRTSPPWKDFQKPDDVAVSRELLAEKFTGPGYFHLGVETKFMPRFYLSTTDAISQIDRIIKERSLSADVRGKLENLIRTLAEPSDSRMVGTDRVNVLQLNLALDEMN